MVRFDIHPLSRTANNARGLINRPGAANWPSLLAHGNRARVCELDSAACYQLILWTAANRGNPTAKTPRGDMDSTDSTRALTRVPSSTYVTACVYRRFPVSSNCVPTLYSHNYFRPSLSGSKYNSASPHAIILIY